ncbi:MAG: 4-diphosphocytidyl-2C-methyl-D-erythritol kinase [Fretibacterium sp.]|nr:4-diphosphocytidyl-2C-methyl-D-erythritol kinase [Fretibacterium sp.]
MLPVSAKLNLTLRVTGRRDDGYHNLVSLFVRIPSAETIFVSPLSPDGTEDEIDVRGLDLRIVGENIVSRALRLARGAGASIPPLRAEITKALYPGSGLGSGSGNAAAVLRWLAAQYPVLSRETWREIARRTGADVPFLFSGLSVAQAAGIGDQLRPLPPLALTAAVAFPDWDVGTENAYASLDSAYRDGYPMNEEGARAEMEDVFRALSEGRTVGLLPNDFLPPLVEAHPQYRTLFGLFEQAKALGWGITGSGSAAFVLFKGEGEEKTAPVLALPDWVRQVLFFNL